MSTLSQVGLSRYTSRSEEKSAATTSREVVFTVFGKAQPAGSKRAFVNPKTGRAIVTDANANSRPWKDSVTAAAMAAYDGPLIEGPLLLEVAFFEPRPKGHFNSKGELNAQGRRNALPTKKPDVTKLVRGTEDALTHVLWRDDAQVVVQVATKQYGEPARAEIRVTPISLEGNLAANGGADRGRAGGT